MRLAPAGARRFIHSHRNVSWLPHFVVPETGVSEQLSIVANAFTGIILAVRGLVAVRLPHIAAPHCRERLLPCQRQGEGGLSSVQTPFREEPLAKCWSSARESIVLFKKQSLLMTFFGLVLRFTAPHPLLMAKNNHFQGFFSRIHDPLMGDGKLVFFCRSLEGFGVPCNERYRA